MVDVILGLQWGDEGKGKIVDFFAKDYDLIARFQGGPNAGHTLYVENKKIVLHQIPSGILHPGASCIIGNGVVLDAEQLFVELDDLTARGIIGAEAEKRQIKTARLRQARLEKEARQDHDEAAKPRRAKAAAPRRARPSM